MPERLPDGWGYGTALEPASIDFMIGEWKGGDLPTGHRGDGFLGNTWYGTTFRSASDVQPIICVDAEGNTKDELYARAKKLDIDGRSDMSKDELAKAIAAKQD